jgi:RNA polymerase sigma-70 factor (ECF subfamily)
VNPWTEAELIQRCRRGEASAWDELFDRHYGPATRFVFQLAPDLSREDADEVAQESFLSVIQHLASFQGGCQLQTWVFRIAANKTRDFREKRQAAKRGSGITPLSLQEEDPETGLTLDPPSPASSPAAQLISREQQAALRTALDRLGDPCREIIELRYFGDLSYEEISGELKLNVKTVSSRLSKCLDRLEQLARAVFSGDNQPVFPSND